MKLSCGLPPGPESVAHARLAQDLGYERIWFFDSPALYEDVWITLGRVAEATDDLGLGTAVLVPHLRHVMVTASAIATIDDIAPGRLACAFGTGATARWTFGKPALRWDDVRRYLEQLRGLLRGEVVEVDGEACRMMHHRALAPARPIEVPLLLSAMGPRGQAIAAEVADGIMTMFGGVEGWDWHVRMVNGTVLEEGEDLDTPRVRDAIGPWAVLPYHGGYQVDPESVDALPGGAEWRARVEAERPEGERHLVVHEGHASHVMERDRPLLDAMGEMLTMMGWVGSAATIRTLADEAAADATELLYTPAGPDVPRELQAFAAAVL